MPRLCPKEDDDLEDIDSLLEKIEETKGHSHQALSGVIADSRPLLYVEHRYRTPSPASLLLFQEPFCCLLTMGHQCCREIPSPELWVMLIPSQQRVC